MKKNEIITIIASLLAITTIGAIAKVSYDLNNKDVVSENTLNSNNSISTSNNKVSTINISFYFENLKYDGLGYYSADCYFKVSNFYYNFTLDDVESFSIEYVDPTEPRGDFISVTKDDVQEYKDKDYFIIKINKNGYETGITYFTLTMKMKNINSKLTCTAKLDLSEQHNY